MNEAVVEAKTPLKILHKTNLFQQRDHLFGFPRLKKKAASITLDVVNWNLVAVTTTIVAGKEVNKTVI